MSEQPSPVDPVPPAPVAPRRVSVGWKLLVALGCVLAAASILLSALLFAANRRLAKDNCTRISRVVGTLDQILINGRASAARYERDGTITRVQLKRALHENDIARSKLYRADCPAGDAPPLLVN